MKKAIERGPKPPRREELDFVDAGYNSVTVTISKGAKARHRVFGDKHSADIMVISSSAGSSSGKTKLQWKFASESVAISAVQDGEKFLREAKEKWESTGKQQFRESKRKRPRFVRDDGPKPTEEER